MKKISLPEQGIETLYGARDANLKHIESLLNVQIRTHGGEITIEGDPKDELRAQQIFKQLKDLIDEGYPLANGDVKTAAQLLVDNADVDLRDYFLKGGQKQVTRRRVTPKSVNQRKYLDAIEQFDIVFGVGPAGTGKTYLAMAQAVTYLLEKKVSRIVLARPAVEAGEKLGFLPGDIAEEGEPVPAPALRRALRHDGHGEGDASDRARHDRGGADRLHARPHAERRVRHPGRGAEHHQRADEDVPHAPRLRVEGGRDRRHHADRPAHRARCRAWSRR